MKIKLGLLLLLFFFTFGGVHAQTKGDSIAINDAKNVIELTFKGQLEPSDYLVYSFPAWVVLVYQQKDWYCHKCYSKSYLDKFDGNEQAIEYSLESTFDIRIPKRQKKKESCILYHMFNEEHIPDISSFFVPDTIAVRYSMSDYITYEYFLLYSNGRKVCEFNKPLPLLVGKNEDIVAVPELDSAWYTYLKEKIIPKLYPKK